MMRWIIKIILFPISLVLSILAVFLTFLLGIGTTLLYLLMMFCIFGAMAFLVVPFEQGCKDMSPPTKELMKLAMVKKLAHGGHPDIRWMMDNIYIKTDPAGNVKADEAKSTEKIDGAVATVMALDCVIRCGNTNSASVYDGRDILFIWIK